MHNNPENLIPELKDWNDGRGISLDGFLSCMGNYEHAIAYTHFLWPTFVLHDGCLFRNHLDAMGIEAYNQWKVHLKDDRKAIESVMNHVHIFDIFPNVEQSPTREQVVFLGRKLKELWAAKLHIDFPELHVVVEFQDDYGDDLLEYVITFFQD